jgi:hypothetical protein
MTEYVLGNEAMIRAGFFFGIFIAVALWEQVSPRRTLIVSKGLRWLNKLGIVFFNTFLLRLLFTLMAVGVAIMAEKGNWGILNNVELKSSVKLFFAVFIFRFCHIYTACRGPCYSTVMATPSYAPCGSGL